MKIAQISPWIDDDDIREVCEAIKSTYVTENVANEQFQSMLKDLTGAKHVVSMANGTLALYAALLSLDIGVGDEVIVPDLTFIATANAVIMTGATPIFCDVNPDSFFIDLDIIPKLIGSNTKAIIPVHLYGVSGNINALKELADSYGVRVIEDAAQGVGVRVNGRHVGTFGDIGVLSFYGNKTITTGEGGACLTESDEIAKRLYQLKNHGRSSKGTFIHETIGFNFSFTDIQAALGVSQLRKLSKIIKRKKEIHDYYYDSLNNTPLEQIKHGEEISPVYWFTSFLADNSELLASYLLERGVQTRRFFYPLHLQPCFKHFPNFTQRIREYPVSENLYERGISLPSACQITQQELYTVTSLVKEFYATRN
jgi:perosamine synthetase